MSDFVRFNVWTFKSIANAAIAIVIAAMLLLFAKNPYAQDLSVLEAQAPEAAWNVSGEKEEVLNANGLWVSGNAVDESFVKGKNIHKSNLPNGTVISSSGNTPLGVNVSGNSVDDTGILSRKAGNGVITVDTSKATICTESECYPTLIGHDTPRGKYGIELVNIRAAGYGGNVLAFKRATGARYAGREVWYSVHRVYTLKPSQRRMERINSGVVSQRLGVTMGCINVLPEVFDILTECCGNGTIVIF